MKKSSIIVLLFVLLLLFAACNRQYSLMSPQMNISSVSIVHLSFDGAALVCTKLCKVADIDAFMSDFERLSCYFWVGDPQPATPEGKEADVIQISYTDGSYELISWYGQTTYTQETGLVYYAGQQSFDETQFKALIEKYMEPGDSLPPLKK